MEDGSTETDVLVDAVAGFIDTHELIAPGARLVVGVSGGCDSVAGLAILRQLARCENRAYELTVAHLDHALRDESPDDAAFVGDLAKRWDLPCAIERIDIAALAAERSLSLETAARMVRYEFLQRIADQAGAKYIAVAHHADDNAETICHRIFRGSHLRGAGGIQASRTLGRSETLLVRPLLNCRRSDIEAFCARENLTFRTDPTNARSDFTRNFIRNELLPLVKRRINPEGDMALVRLGKALADAEEFIASQASDIAAGSIRRDRPGQTVIDLRPLDSVHRTIRGWIFREAMELAGIASGKVSAGKLEELSALADNDARTVNLPDNFVARRREHTIIIAAAVEPETPAEAPIILPECGQTVLPSGATIACEPMEFDAELFQAHCRRNPSGVELLNADMIRGRLVCRPRRPGDRFRPLGLDGSQTVSDFLTNSNLDRKARDGVRCVCDDEGIVYLAPLRIDQRVKVAPDSRRLIRIEVKAPSEPTEP
ncbi:MAG: tRNA lysidine(34) synthetase TilS [Phycisphaerae bacterium]|jgi:tRNA(Ile)-lysidine synthase|nr:tRNA lysidine(34) synthetase TilS [Phycisphaerae bacterium]